MRLGSIIPIWRPRYRGIVVNKGSFLEGDSRRVVRENWKLSYEVCCRYLKSPSKEVLLSTLG